jgi:hypothetical protein
VHCREASRCAKAKDVRGGGVFQKPPEVKIAARRESGRGRVGGFDHIMPCKGAGV